MLTCSLTHIKQKVSINFLKTSIQIIRLEYISCTLTQFAFHIDNFSNMNDILNIRILKVYLHALVEFRNITISRNSFRMTLIVYQIYIDYLH